MRCIRAVRPVVVCLLLIGLSACGSDGTPDAGERPDRGRVLPPAPTNVTAEGGNGLVTLSWESAVSAQEYRIYYATEPGVTATNYMDLASGGVASAVSSPFDVTGLENGRVHYFVITAVVRTIESLESEEVNALPTGALNVTPVYSGAARWTRHIANDGTTPFTGSGSACAVTSPAPDACLHGGEMRVAVLSDTGSCDGVTVRDTLGAFDWVCLEGSPVRVASLGLKPGKRLADLIDFENLSFLPMGLEVRIDDVVAAETLEDTIWWDNPIEEFDDTRSLSVSETIFVIRASRIAHIQAFQHNVALTMPDGVTVRCNPLESEVVSLANRNQAWIEGAFSGEGACADVIRTQNLNRSVFRGVRVERNSNAGGERACMHLNGSGTQVTDGHLEGCNSAAVILSGGPQMLQRTDIVRSDGVRLQSSGSILRDVDLFGTLSGTAVSIDGSYNALYDLRIVNTDATAIELSRYAVRNVVTNALIVGSRDRAIRFNQSADNIFARVTVAHTIGDAVVGEGTGDPGHPLGDRSLSQLFVSFAALDVDGALVLTGPEAYSFVDTVFAPHAGTAITIDSGRSNYFGGLLRLGSSSSCAITGGASPGLLDGTCDDGAGIFPGQLSDATFAAPTDVSASLVGPVSADGVNAEDGVLVRTDAIQDATHFENDYRVWARPETGSVRGRCEATDDCQVWDFSLATGDDTMRGVLALPTSTDVVRHVWAAFNEDQCDMVRGGIWATGSCRAAFLAHAVEIMGDRIGNDNALCESDEACLYTPNLGAYQGHGALIDAGPLAGSGELEDVTLLRYAENGR